MVNLWTSGYRKMDFKDSDGIEDDKYVIFKQDDLHLESFPIMKEIRRQGKLCDVTLKVGIGFKLKFEHFCWCFFQSNFCVNFVIDVCGFSCGAQNR